MLNNILIRPIVTEKSMKDAARNCYTFAVAKESNKAQIAMAIKESFSVKPISIKTITVKGKTRRSGRTRQETKTSLWKKAIVELEIGQKIGLFDANA